MSTILQAPAATSSAGAIPPSGLHPLASERFYKSNSDDASYVDDIYDRILLAIIRGERPSGSVLSSTRLARELGVSRTPVVVALERLAADGIVFKEKNRRAIVQAGAENLLVEVHELRLLVEPPAAAIAAERITPAALAKLRELADEACPEPSGESPSGESPIDQRPSPAWAAMAREFDYGLHLAIADHCGNLPLRKTIYKCWSFKRISYVAGHDSVDGLTSGYNEHLAILSALISRDAGMASAAMLFHLRSAAAKTQHEQIV
jgi:DNA-binding GntR family transcriptional regulator